MMIAEVSKKYDISDDALRYYERVGLIPCVTRTSGGVRNYTDSDCGWVEFIKCMRSAGMPVEVLVKYVSMFQEGDATAEARKSLLIEQRDKLIERIKDMQNVLERLNCKIENYEKAVMPTEKKLNKSRNARQISNHSKFTK
jgi:MerR family transcriptional regulator, aldehyde-responsive regulator